MSISDQEKGHMIQGQGHQEDGDDKLDERKLQKYEPAQIYIKLK